MRSPHLKHTSHNPNPIKILAITSTRSLPLEFPNHPICQL
ncbi:hypothetical protein MC7420_4898 [Coleofasciculus chthonoplastes PCC 7420]|uniref:Uncharacterized protein n=1 Tax=Coleofasciculus chthonoplastes PCC 7420 TaxID=118168 RepID=B4VNI7_9CYAN|nr:hypothetical protein MC7420_4898 [Coleofasciculus chthonoplastes PCC 7420]